MIFFACRRVADIERVTMFVIASVMNFASYWFSDRMVLRMYRAQIVDRASAPDLPAVKRWLAAKRWVIAGLLVLAPRLLLDHLDRASDVGAPITGVANHDFPCQLAETPPQVCNPLGQLSHRGVSHYEDTHPYRRGEDDE